MNQPVFLCIYVFTYQSKGNVTDGISLHVSRTHLGWVPLRQHGPVEMGDAPFVFHESLSHVPFFQGQMWLALVIFKQSCACNLQFPRDHAVHVAIKSWTNSISKPVYRPSATESHDQVFNEQKQQKQSKPAPFYLPIFSDTSSYELTLALLLMVEDSKRSCRW